MSLSINIFSSDLTLAKDLIHRNPNIGINYQNPHCLSHITFSSESFTSTYEIYVHRLIDFTPTSPYALFLIFSPALENFLLTQPELLEDSEHTTLFDISGLQEAKTLCEDYKIDYINSNLDFSTESPEINRLRDSLQRASNKILLKNQTPEDIILKDMEDFEYFLNKIQEDTAIQSLQPELTKSPSEIDIKEAIDNLHISASEKAD